MSAQSHARVRPRVLIVGAFPKEGSKVVGGVLRNCQILQQSAFSSMYELSLVDSTQRSNPAPSFLPRLGYAALRWVDFIRTLVRDRPDHAMLFAGIGFSLVEKSLMALVCQVFGTKPAMFPMAGQMIHETGSNKRLRLWYRLIFSTSSTLLCQGQAWISYLHGSLGIRKDRLVIVNSWTATPELLAIGARRQTGVEVEEGWVNVVFIGWLELEKGIQELIRVFPRIANDYRVKLTVIGGGSLAQSLAETIAAHGLTDRVTFTGWLGAERVADVLARSDLFVLPSWGEGMPNSLIEAMATKVPVIVTRVGSVPDFIVDGDSGILVSPRSEAELEQGLRRMIADPALRVRCAEKAYVIARERLSIDNAIAQMKPTFDS